jgi:hypothetical protein
MATRKPKAPKRDARLPGEAQLERVYHAAGHDLPPPALDAAILAEAQRAVARPTPAKPFHLRWAVPLSTAAVVVLAVGVVLLMTQEGALNHRAELDAPNEYTPAPAAPPAADTATRELRDSAEPARAKRAAPEPAKVLAQPSSPAVQATAPAAEFAESKPAELMKKAEAPPATAAPQMLGGAMDTERNAAAREEKARARSTAAGVAAMSIPAADVIGVQVSGSPGAYQFNVTIKSPDTGCKQYADWWEVVSEDGKLRYRRVLLHSHVDEQPFTRSGGPVSIQADTVVWVRAHMNTGGYGGVAFKGSAKVGFKQAVPDAEFAVGLAKQAPLPDGCDF